MTRTPASVKWALLLMAGLVLSQIIGVRRLQSEDAAGEGLQAATMQAADSTKPARHVCPSSLLQRTLRIASRPGAASLPRTRSAS
jgi:hypothetical protein